jgi:hypothetical protein
MSFTLQDSVFTANVNNDGGYLSIVIRPKNAPTPTSWALVVMAPAGVRTAGRGLRLTVASEMRTSTEIV